MSFRIAVVAAPLVAAFLACQSAVAEEPAPPDNYWTLVHDEAVLADLQLTGEQRARFREILDPLDLRCFPLRNKSAAEATAGFAAAAEEAKQKLAKWLKPRQSQRLALV